MIPFISDKKNIAKASEEVREDEYLERTEETSRSVVQDILDEMDKLEDEDINDFEHHDYETDLLKYLGQTSEKLLGKAQGIKIIAKPGVMFGSIGTDTKKVETAASMAKSIIEEALKAELERKSTISMVRKYIALENCIQERLKSLE